MTGLGIIKRKFNGSVICTGDRINIGSIILFFVALAPVLQHYNEDIVNPALAILACAAFVALVKIIARQRIRINIAFVFLLIYDLYEASIHGINMTYLLRSIVQLLVCLAVINGLFEIKTFIKCCQLIAVCATVLIIVQYLCFYVFGFHLQLVSTALLNPDNSQWFGLIQTGTISVNGKVMAFYRPSAFFLEPSHFAIYCIPVIVATLFSYAEDEKRKIRLAFFISIGVVLSTSGMGIGIVIASWIAYIVFFYRQNERINSIKIRNLFKPRSIALLLLILGVLVMLYVCVPFFRQSVSRIFMSASSSGLNAIEGRTMTGMKSLQMMQGTRRFIGFGSTYNIAGWNMPAFFFVTFKFGWIGTVLFYAFYVYSAFRLKREAQVLSIIFIILSFFTLLVYGIYYRLFYTMIILNGYAEKRVERKAEAAGQTIYSANKMSKSFL